MHKQQIVAHLRTNCCFEKSNVPALDVFPMFWLWSKVYVSICVIGVEAEQDKLICVFANQDRFLKQQWQFALLRDRISGGLLCVITLSFQKILMQGDEAVFVLLV